MNKVPCPGLVTQIPSGAEVVCGSYEITFGTPLYKDREYDEVVIEGVCDSCGHQFQVFGHVVITKVDKT